MTHRIIIVRWKTNQKKRLESERAIYLLVVPLGDARAEPHAVVVELEHAVVASVAVGGSRGAEDAARLAELKLENHRTVHLADLQVGHFCGLRNIGVLLRQVAAFNRPPSARHDAWVSAARAQHKEGSCKLKVPEKRDGNLPVDPSRPEKFECEH